MARLVSLTSILALVCTIAGLPSPGSKSAFQWNSIKYLIAFGDSYTYVQGTHGRQNFSFVGDLQNLNFSSQDLLSNRIVQNQTSTAEGGPNWVEYLTECGLKPGLTQPKSCKVQLWDFAFAGADISEKFTPLHHNFTVPLDRAVDQFRMSAQPVLGEFVDPDEALVGVWIGINDINDSAKYQVDFADFYDQLMNTLFASMQTVYDLGYKNFLFMNLPPLDRTQANLVSPTPLPNKTMIGWWNDALERHAHAFEVANADAKAMLFDANAFLNMVLDSPVEYGIKNVTGYCASYDQPLINEDPAEYGCLPLDQYFWFNSGHMTSHTHRILSGAVEQFLMHQ